MDGLAVEIERVLGAVAGLVLAVAVALALSPGAGASQSRSSKVGVVGTGTLNWSHVIVRAKPSERSRRVAVLKEFRLDFSPQYVLAVSKYVHPRTGVPNWYRITVPGRPNGRTGWVRAAAVELRPVQKRLVIDRSARRFDFWQGDKLLRSGQVAVGKPGAATPTGLFFVQSKFVPNAAILGAFAFETSAYSQLTDWPGGGVVGVHGTPWPWLLGQAVSHGCIRLHNTDVLWLRARMPVGTPIKIVP
jgi:lipoprotein-anchoring transpeptidase ErfK/SrfK